MLCAWFLPTSTAAGPKRSAPFQQSKEPAKIHNMDSSYNRSSLKHFRYTLNSRQRDQYLYSVISLSVPRRFLNA